MSKRLLTGRKMIFTNEREINSGNVLKVLNDALMVHQDNRADIKYLYNYVRGKQPIIDRKKAVREEICNKIVVNRANEIVTFKTANFIGEPLQYVSRGANESVPNKIEQLNSFMLSENKHSKDMSLAYWMFICGLGYRLTLNDKAAPYENGELLDEAPFEIFTLDPRNTFVVRRNDVTKKTIMGVTYVYKNNDLVPEDSSEVEYTVYTENETYRITGSLLTANNIDFSTVHNTGILPVTEYQCNQLRMGAFEIVIDLLDAINLTESNRLDGVEQFIQALLVLENVDLTREQFLELKDLGAIKVPSIDGRTSRLYYLNEQLDQSQTQTLVDDLYQTVKEIVGIPSQGNANTSDSSNNGAIIMKNGWWNAEARAKETEGMWREAETDFLKIVLKICNDANAIDLRVSDIEQKFTRRSYEDKLTKTNAFKTLMDVGVPPIQAYTISDLVLDPESASIAYGRYQEVQNEKLNESLENSLKAAQEEHVHTDEEEIVTAQEESE